MLKRELDFFKKLRAVVYLRVSDDKQNPRSPDQQLAEIKRRLKAMKYPWTIVKIYRDDFISGQLVRKRPQFQQMLRDVRSGDVVVDLILVDTTERLGRNLELPHTINRLREVHGVLLLVAANNFVDPTTPAGRAMEILDTSRATEENRAKAHNVVRGKRDMIEQGKWPGSHPPFGLKLVEVMKIEGGRDVVDYHTIAPDPATAWIIEKLYQMAFELSWGAGRITQAFNADPQIPEYLKPLNFTTVGRWLSSPLYAGDLVWNAHSTGIVNDVRVKEKNPEHEVVCIKDFCEAIVPRDVWDAVQALRHARGRKIRESREVKLDASLKTIRPRARGLTVGYPLSGLVFCECGLRMVASSTSEYTTKSGDSRRYTVYVCPSCRNTAQGSVRVSEEWLRGAVLAKLFDRLLS